MSSPSTAPAPEREDRILLILDDPVVGLAPWLVWGLLPYVASALVSALIAAGLALAIVALTYWRGEKPKVLELSDVALFVPLVLVALVATDGVNSWFEDHADLLSNGALTVMAVVSLLLDRPFTSPYTEARFPGMDEELQDRLDTVATAAWALGLGVATAVAWYGEYVLNNPNDLWTGWILQLVPLMLAYNATLWFDRRAVLVARGDLADRPSGWELVLAIVVWLAPVGVLAIAVHEAPRWMAGALIVGGLALTLIAWQTVRRHRLVARTPFVLLDEEDEADMQ